MNRRNVFVMGLLLVLMPGWLMGQEAPTQFKPIPVMTGASQPVPENLVLRVFSLKHADLNTALSLTNIHAYRVGPVGPRSLAVYATADQMPMVEKLMAGLDVPQPGANEVAPLVKQWRVMLFLLGTGEAGSGQAPPTILRSVIQELEQAFPYRGYTLRDAVPVLVTPGSDTTITSLLSSAAPDPETNLSSDPYTVQFRKTSPHPRTEGISCEVAVDFNVRVPAVGGPPTQFQYRQLNIRSTVFISAGESVVLGKVRDSSAGGNLFVVLHMPKQ